LLRTRLGENSHYLPGEAEPAFGDCRSVHSHDSLHKGYLSGHFHNCYFQYHRITRVYRNEESDVADGRQNQELALIYAFASGLAKKDRGSYQQRPWLVSKVARAVAANIFAFLRGTSSA